MKFFKKLWFYVPTKLPAGMTEFDEFAKDIFETYDFPDMPGYRQAVATQILHFGTQVTHKPKRYFYKTIRKAQVNEIAYQVVIQTRDEIKNLPNEPEAKGPL